MKLRFIVTREIGCKVDSLHPDGKKEDIVLCRDVDSEFIPVTQIIDSLHILFGSWKHQVIVKSECAL